MPSVAAKIGIPKATLLWYISEQAFGWKGSHELLRRTAFPFVPVETLRRYLKQLEKDGYLIATQAKGSMNRTKTYYAR